jgi:response regulator RpfG family c-di-GMP phosphodiesterase
MRQARLALLQAGHLATVDAALAQDPAAKIQWEYATHVYRTDALVGQMAQLLSLSDQQLDELFIAAAKL